MIKRKVKELFPMSLLTFIVMGGLPVINEVPLACDLSGPIGPFVGLIVFLYIYFHIFVLHIINIKISILSLLKCVI